MTISGPSPNEPTYQKDFQESVNLFEKGFQGVQTASFDQQRAQYVKVMNEALKTMQESASGLVNDRLISLKNDLSHDLNQYLDTPTTENQEKIQSDIDSLKSESE